MPRSKQPIDAVQWVDPATLTANDFNPNRVFGQEMALLKRSILDTGWTMPILVKPDGTIIDGFHRWTLASKDEEVREALGGECPVVVVNVDEAEHRLATVRHNRARGYHGLTHMAQIVRDLVGEGLTRQEIQERCGMEPEEVDRFLDLRDAPEAQASENYGEGWVAQNPERKSGGGKKPKHRG
jgi:ParB-like chromosome segregation protein Spo0J